LLIRKSKIARQKSQVSPYHYLRSIAISRATRSSVGGCVLNSLATLLPVSGWTMNRLL
jgi:hypothetical protein